MPKLYICKGSGMVVAVTEVVQGMSLISSDYLEGELIPGDFIVDFPDGSTQVISEETLLSEYAEVINRK